MSKTAFRRVGLTVKSTFDCKDDVLQRVLTILREAGCTVFIDRKRTRGMPCVDDLRPLEGAEIDLLLVLGGDGTILRAIRELEDRSIPVLSVNRGAVGFLAETNVSEIDELLPAFLRGQGEVERRSLLSIEVRREDGETFSGFALNEAVIAQGAIARLLRVQTAIDGEALTTYNADGLIISTPTGSTAYSLAAGGPIVHPSLEAMILTPINPHSFSQKPIVIPSRQTVEVEVLPKEHATADADVSLTLDGQIYHPLRRHDRVTVRMTGDCVKFLRRSQDTFFATLRKKLKWGGAE